MGVKIGKRLSTLIAGEPSEDEIVWDVAKGVKCIF